MNWFKENKFLGVFAIVMVIGVAVLAFLLFSATGKYAEVSDTYNTQASQLQSLQALIPSRNQENLNRAKQQKEEYLKKITALQDKVASMQFSAEPLSPSSFQGSLKEAVNDVINKAASTGTTLPDRFYGGFQDYESAPPRNEASISLGQELKAIKFVVMSLLDAKVSAITAISRDPLAQKTKAPAADNAGPVAPKPRGPKAAKDESDNLMVRQSFQIAFTTDLSRLRKALNTISTSDEQFLVVRNIRVHNEQMKGPSRVQAGAPGAPATTADTNAGQPATGTGEDHTNDWLRPIVGQEKVNVTLTVDIIDFAKPAAKTAAK